MRTNKTPAVVSEFENLLSSYLESFEKTLEFAEHSAEPQPTWRYHVKDVAFPSEVLIHQTQDSLSSGQPQYRVRAWAEIDGDLGQWFKGSEAWVNRYTSLGALLVHEKNASLTCQFLIRENDLDVCTALLAIAVVHGANSLVQSVGRTLNKDAELEAVKVISQWSDLDFEQIQYDFAHLGIGRQGQGSWRLKGMHGTVEMMAVNNNPFWQGGMLVLNTVDKARLGISGKAPINEMNAFEQLASDIPVFGGWCDDGDNVTFVSFIPNFAKGVSNLTSHLLSWGQRRLRYAPELVKYSMEFKQESDEHELSQSPV